MLRRLGYRTAILSGGFTFFGRVLQQRLGIDHLHANALDILDGVVTGEVRAADRGRRAEGGAAAGDRGERRSQPGTVIAVGDGANDLPMLRLAGLGIAFRAKPVVRSGRASVDLVAGARRHPVSDWRPRPRGGLSGVSAPLAGRRLSPWG